MSENAFSKYPVQAFSRGTQETQKGEALNGDVAALFNSCSEILDPKQVG